MDAMGKQAAALGSRDGQQNGSAVE
jgi:hypothetical protein